MPKYSKPKRIDPGKCKGCELCVVVCKRDVLKMSDALDARGNRLAEIVAIESCNRCGHCFLICPDNAIE